MRKQSKRQAKELIGKIWSPPKNWNAKGAWFWWFWLFFIHDKDTEKTGKCRQLMILWSIKKDPKIKCNSLDIEFPVQFERKGGKFQLNGAAAAWYYDGKNMHHDFVLEKTAMTLDPEKKSLTAPGKTPSEFYMDGKEFVTKIAAQGKKFEFRARKIDSHPAVGPTYGSTKLPFGMGLEGTRLEIMELSGFESAPNGKRSGISGTAYFQKILVAAPPPQWYWGLYHFKDGSFFTYMVPYIGRAMLAGNLWKMENLRKPSLPIKQDILIYHAPSGRVFEGNRVSIRPSRIDGSGLWRHDIKGGGIGFSIVARADAYSHSCWKFVKSAGPLPFKSAFKYNEYPSLVHLELALASGERIRLKKGWGNMENAWGFLI